MSPDTIAVGVFTIAGTLLGVVVGALTERLVRATGRLRFGASVSSLLLTGVGTGEPGGRGRIPLAEADETTKAEGVHYVCAVDLFNGKEVPTGLHDIRVEFVLDNGERVTSHPLDSATYRAQAHISMYDELAVLNLPPRQFVRKELRGSFGKEVASALISGKWRRIEFAGEFHRRPILGLLGSKTYRKTIIEPQD